MDGWENERMAFSSGARHPWFWIPVWASETSDARVESGESFGKMEYSSE